MDSWGINPELSLGMDGITINDVLNGFIIESGHNDNGDYIKFSNGEMICQNIVELSLPGTINEYGPFFYKECFQGWTNYAVPFIEIPINQLWLINSGSIIFIQQSNLGDKNVPGGFFYYAINKATSNQSCKIAYRAIGKWK